MFDFDAGKLMIIATVALVVIGPKDLPRVLRQIGQMVTKVRRMAGEFQNQFMDAMKEADIQDLRNEVAKIKDSASLDLDFNPAHEIKTQLDEAMATPRASKSFPMSSGTTSETQPMNLPAASEIRSMPASVPADEQVQATIGSSGFGPAIDIATLPEPAAIADALSVPAAPADSDAGPRIRVMLPRRKIASRFDLANFRAPAIQRSRNIRPARRETPES